MTHVASSSYAARKLVRVAAFYTVLAAGAYLAVRHVPAARAAFGGDRLEELRDGLGAFASGAPPPAASVEALPDRPWSMALLGAVSMLGALAIMVPVTWVYMLTRHRRGFDESVVHTLLILPVAVTGIVMIVQNSLALAFSLAGIVAAVRFRTTLEDTKDAVYVFLAIGVGLASGVQALGLAFVLSLVFNAVVLALWGTRFGNAYVDAGTGAGGLGLGDALAGPGSALSAVRVGDPALLDAVRPRDLREVAEQAARMERRISEERRRKKSRRANALVLAHAPEAEAAQRRIEPILDELSTRWRIAEIVPAGEDGVVLEYLVRVDGPGMAGALMDRIGRLDGVVRSAELRSLRGLKSRA